MAFESSFQPDTLAVVTSANRDEAFFDFAEGLAVSGYELIASHGTALALHREGFRVATFSEIIKIANGPELDRESQGLYLAGQICNEQSMLGPAIGLVCVGLNPDKIDVAGTALLGAAKRMQRIAVGRSNEYVKVLQGLQDGSAKNGMRESLGRTAAFVVSDYWAKESRYEAKPEKPEA